MAALFAAAAHAWSQQTQQTWPVDSIPAADANQSSAAQSAQEQSSQGSIHGVVLGKDGSVYEGARIALSTAAAPLAGTGEPRVWTATTNSDGRFNFSGIAPGDFKLTVTSQGFATQQVAVLLHAGESYETQAIVLPFATASNEVHVTATQQEIALEQLKVEETQRVFGVIPNFYVSYVPNAAPLTSRQKYSLAFKTSIDPITFAITGAFAGVEQADDAFSGYGQGAQGYAKRYAAGYADGFIGTMIGSAILPSILKQDPRYFYKGTGTTRSRILYAVANAVVCKGDNGHWQVDYSGILGSLAAGGISNLYYPASNRNGAALIFESTLIGTAGSAAQNLFQEFLVRKLTPKVPSYKSSNP